MRERAGYRAQGRRWRRQGFALTLVVAGAALFVLLGGWDFVRDGERVEEFFTERGAVGPVVFVLAMWALQPAGVPGLVFMVPAAVVWPLPTAMLLSWVGNMGASSIAFAMARYLARDWVQQRMPTRLRGWDRRLADGGLVQVILLRVITGQFTPADWVLGVSTVGAGTFLVGTAIGIIPGIVLAVTLGGGIIDLLGERWMRVSVLAAVVVALGIRRARRARRARGLAPPIA
ncbi:MAG: VTT domain-containing protein [Acidimicrobiales bacterium]